MFSKASLLTLLAFASPLLVCADVIPSEPGPGSSFNAGTTCKVTWEGDKDSTSLWKDMSIELMSGSNFDMKHLTTVATNQDGTVDGQFTFPCPDVTPFSNIYFYQFTSTHTSTKTWTTRFTIASSSGQTVPPANAVQPGSNDPIPWGIGALADPSTALPAPAIGDLSANSTSSSSALSSSSTIASSTIISSSSSRLQTSTQSSSSASPNATSQANATSDAPSSLVFENRALGAAFTLTASAVVFAMLL